MSVTKKQQEYIELIKERIVVLGGRIEFSQSDKAKQAAQKEISALEFLLDCAGQALTSQS